MTRSQGTGGVIRFEENSTYLRADAAIRAYEVALNASHGQKSEATETRLLVLEIDALDACEAASRDRSVNQVTRDFYRREAEWFRAQVAAERPRSEDCEMLAGQGATCEQALRSCNSV